MRGRALAVCEVLTAQAYAFAGADSPCALQSKKTCLTWGWALGAVLLPAIGSAAATAMKYPPRSTVGFSLQ